MAKRILLRAHKNPFEVVPARRVLQQNLIGDNLGNLLASNAAYKLLDTHGTTITTSRLRRTSGGGRRLSDRYDQLVLPLANAFRLSYVDELDQLSALIERLDVPVTVLGVGAQLNLDGSFERLEPIRAPVRRFVSAVLDHAPSIGVRGERTAEYLHSLGFRDIEIIGCPSAFLRGPALHVTKRAQHLTRSSRISMNLHPAVQGLGAVVEAHTQRYPRLHYTAQHRDALAMLLARGAGRAGYTGAHSQLPVTLTHPLVTEGRMSTFTDPQPWLDHLAGFDFSFGTRIDGNIAAMLAGTPAYVLAHDSSTLELARHFGIPHRTTWRVHDRTDVATLHEEADYSDFNRDLAGHFDRLAAFLRTHQLHHVYEAGQDPHQYDLRTATTRYPGEITTATGPTAGPAAQRLLGDTFRGKRRNPPAKTPAPAPVRTLPAAAASQRSSQHAEKPAA